MTKAKESKSETTGAPASEVECLLTPTEIKSLVNDLEIERELRMRALADFDNYRKRVERERESEARAGKRAIVLALLEVMDDFDRALDHAGESPKARDAPDPIAEGLRAIHKRMAGVIQAQGVTPIKSVREKFDPTLHEAVSVTEDGDAEPGTVVAEMSRGYLWNGELLRPARVRVAK